MRAPLLAVANGDAPRKRANVRVSGMGQKWAKAQTSDRSPREDCLFCGIVKGAGSRKIYEVDHRVLLMS